MSESAPLTHSAVLLEVQRAADSSAAGCCWRLGAVRSVPSVGTAALSGSVPAGGSSQKTLVIRKIRLSYHNVVYLERNIVGNDSAKCGRKLTTVRRQILPAFSGSCMLKMDRSCNAFINCNQNIRFHTPEHPITNTPTAHPAQINNQYVYM